MQISAVLFDLDGTLYPIDTEAFEEHYIKTMTDSAVAAGFDRETFLSALDDSSRAIKANDGRRLNREVFIESYTASFGRYDKETDDFFEGYFSSPDFLPPDSAENPLGKEIVRKLKKRGFTVVLATNPFSPKTGTLARLRAAGMEEKDFDWITVMENASFCKPKLEYYRQIAQIIGKQPEECLMVGNDVGEDMPAGEAGMETFLVTDKLTNRQKKDFSAFRRGTLKEFAAFTETLRDPSA